MQPTRQEQLDFINHKIARTGGGTGPGETGYYLPIDEHDLIVSLLVGRSISEGSKLCKKAGKLWNPELKTLDKQSDQCISYIFTLLSHV